jgi:hypothetical protein
MMGPFVRIDHLATIGMACRITVPEQAIASDMENCRKAQRISGPTRGTALMTWGRQLCTVGLMAHVTEGRVAGS